MEQKTDLAHTVAARAGSESPTSKCPICLTQIDNPAFTDICIHQFCYTCLCEWAKVKAVCPVCKQQFQTIAYNVQSYEKFDELPVRNLTVPDNRTEFQMTGLLSRRFAQIHRHPQDARFRYRTTMTSDYRDVLRRLEEQRITEELRNPSVRVTINHRPFVFSSEVRKAVYRTGLRVQHLQTPTEQVFSLITPGFFNDNPACKIRLSPWLQRELDVMAEFGDIPVTGDTMYLINLILSLLNTLKITSQNFYNRLYPCLRRYTLHFLQELYCFARSAPYTMPQYDSCVVYGDGTSGAIWSEWHRDKAHSSSRIPAVIHDATMEEITQLPSERSLLSFVVRNVQRTSNRRSGTLGEGTSGTRTNPNGLIDLVCELSDSNSEVEVMAQEPPWDARLPIVISDSEEETTDREAKAKNATESKFKDLVSKTSREHREMSRDPSQNSGSFENRPGYLFSELSDENATRDLQNNRRRRKGKNISADGRRGISEMSEGEIARHRHKDKHHRSSSDTQQNYSNNDSQSDGKKRKSKDRKYPRNRPQEEHSSRCRDLRPYHKRFSNEHSTSTEQRRRYNNLSGEGSIAYQRSRSKEQSRAYEKIHFKEQYRRSHSKERDRANRKILAKENSRARRRSHSREHQSSHSTELHREHREKNSDDRTISCSSEFPSCFFVSLDGRLKERQQTLQHIKRKRHISEQTYSCDSSETEAYRMSSDGATIGHYCSVSQGSPESQSSSIENPNLPNSCASVASYRPSLFGKVQDGDAQVRLRTDVDSSPRSYDEIDSGICTRDSEHKGARISSHVNEENGEVNDTNFIRRTDFWSDDEENDDVVPSGSNTLKSQIGCMMFAGNGEASSSSQLRSSYEELIVIESSNYSSSDLSHFSEDCDTGEARCSYKNKKRKNRSQSCTRYKKLHKKHKRERQHLNANFDVNEASCSHESQQSKKRRSQSHMSYKNHKVERQNVSTGSREHGKMTDKIQDHANLGLHTNISYETEAQHKTIDADDGMSGESLNVTNELKFKKHFAGHKNSHLKKAVC